MQRAELWKTTVYILTDAASESDTYMAIGKIQN